jgi:hypothetical protein
LPDYFIVSQEQASKDGLALGILISLTIRKERQQATSRDAP